MRDSRQPIGSILDGRSEPNVREVPKGRMYGVPCGHPLGSLRQNLEGVVVSRGHRLEYLLDELVWHSVMEQVAHRIDEDHSGLAPAKGSRESVRPELQVEALLVRVARH